MSTLTDQELVAACLAGKESAFAVLIERYQARLYRIAARICRHPADAEDAVQEAFVQAIRDLGGWRPIAPLEAWLVRITVRVAQKVDMKSARVERGSARLERDEPGTRPHEYVATDVATDPAATAAQRETIGELERAVAALPTKYRAAVALRFGEGLSVREAADALGVPEATLRTHAARGLRLLQAALGNSTLMAESASPTTPTRRPKL